MAVARSTSRAHRPSPSSPDLVRSPSSSSGASSCSSESLPGGGSASASMSSSSAGPASSSSSGAGAAGGAPPPTSAPPPSRPAPSSNNPTPRGGGGGGGGSRSPVVPSGFRLAAGTYARESHGHPIYCVAWSTDLYRETDRQRAARAAAAAAAAAEAKGREAAGKAGGDSAVAADEEGAGPPSAAPAEGAESSPAAAAAAAAESDSRPPLPPKAAATAGSLPPPPPPASPRPAVAPLLRCLATCGGRNVTLYETEATGVAGFEPATAATTASASGSAAGASSAAGAGGASGSSDGPNATGGPPPPRGSGSASGPGSGLSLRQAYVDPDDGELFYTCAFGGRSLGSACGFGRTADLVEDGKGRIIVLHAESSSSEPDEEEEEEDDNDDDEEEEEEEEEGEGDGDERGDSGGPPASKKRKRSGKSPVGGGAARVDGDGGEDDDDGDDDNDEDRERTERERHRSLFRSLADLSRYDGPQLLCAAGRRGVVKVIDTVRRFLLLTLSGHGDEIYDMKFSPTDEWLLLTASKDESLRLWNVRTGTCVAIFAGHEGHRDAVLSVGWHPLGRRFASAGMDTTVKLWSLDGGEVKGALEESRTVTPRRRTAPSGWERRAAERDADEGGGDGRGGGANGGAAADEERRAKKKAKSYVFRTVYEQMPYFSTNKVHTDYVDCVQFVGDLVLSKSITDRIVLWKPDLTTSGRCPNEAATAANSGGGGNGSSHGNSNHSHGGGIGGNSNSHSGSGSNHSHASSAHAHQRSKLRNNVVPLREFTLNKCDVWFVRFHADADCRSLAVGNNAGEVKVWDVGSPNPNRRYFANLTHARCSSTVRMVGFSPDGRSLVATCDDSTVWKWDAV